MAVEIKYNDAVLPLVMGGEAVTIPCVGKYMAGDLVITADTPCVITYNGVETELTAGQVATFKCGESVIPTEDIKIEATGLITPRVSVSETTLEIYDESGLAEGYDIYADGKLVGTTYGTEGLSFEKEYVSDEGYYRQICTGMGTATDTDIVIPSVVDGYPVEKIKDYVFNPAFTDIKLTSVVMPNVMRGFHVGVSTFANQKELKRVFLPKIINHQSTQDYNLEFAFGQCDGLRTITLPDGSSPTERTFVGCDNLNSIVIPVSVTVIDWNTFADCNNIKHIYYKGTEEQWKAVTIGTNNGSLATAKVHFNYGVKEGETE